MSGDVVGPGFFTDFLDAEVTLRKPFGSGEQNAYNFAYTFYNLLYLKVSDQLKPETLSTGLEGLNIGKNLKRNVNVTWSPVFSWFYFCVFFVYDYSIFWKMLPCCLPISL